MKGKTSVSLHSIPASCPARVFLAAALAIGLHQLSTPVAQCQTLTILHSFAGGRDGKYPYGSLVRDGAGNFYGTTASGGTYQNGAVFKLSPKSGGGWTTSLIYSFKGVPDGAAPIGSVVFDTAGNLYGTTGGGGTGVCSVFVGCGTVFKLSPATSGKWKETVLHSFTGGADGTFPYAGVIFSGGNLFGTTFTGGGNGTGCYYLGCGVIFEMTPSSSGGRWKETVAYTFTGGNDGGEPWYGSLIADGSGNLYGTTSYTGCDGCDGYYPTVFELSPNGTGWTLSTLYTFTDYEFSLGGLVLDNVGNLYGTTNSSAYGYGFSPQGAVFELTRSGGTWSRNTLHAFSGGSDGKYPYAGVTFDAAGNLYGTTYEGGNSACSSSSGGCGVVYKLAISGGSWSFSTLHAFSGYPGDGALPYAGTVIDSAGNLYGSTAYGGTHGFGTVFQITP